MARIPLRALGRPLSGKHARFGNTPLVAPPIEVAPPTAPVDVAIVATTAVDVAVAVDVAPEPTPTQTEPKPDDSVDALLADVAATHIEPALAPKPEWDANWSKTKLITFAQSKGVSVTATNTKDEIIAALAGK